MRGVKLLERREGCCRAVSVKDLKLSVREALSYATREEGREACEAVAVAEGDFDAVRYEGVVFVAGHNVCVDVLVAAF